MNGFAPASRSRIVRTLFSLACMTLLACAIPLHAAAPSKAALTRSSVPAGLRTAIGHAPTDDGWVQTQEFTETDPMGFAEFGASVVVHGTTAMIGQQQATVNGNEAQGAVYVFQQASDGTWIQTQKLVSNDGQEFDTFGNTIAFEGNTALIGAYGAAVGDNYSQGAVYVFTFANGSWTQTQKITAADGQSTDNFGFSLGLSGTTAIICADGAQVGNNPYQGAAYVYDGSSGTWTNTQKLAALDGGIGDIFGISMAFDGTHAVFGAYGNNGFQGAAYVFGRVNGQWTQTQKLLASDGASNAYFGGAAALSGSTIMIGAWGAAIGGNDMQGAVYAYTESNGTWSQVQELTAADGMLQDKFGHSIALQGTTAMIGADGWSDASAQGAVYVFDGTSGTFVQAQQLTASDGQPSFQFGLPVAFDGNNAVVGSWLWQSPDTSVVQGAAYFFGLNAAPPPTYTIGGTVSGLAGSGLVLRQNGADDIAIGADGGFTFATPVNNGTHYSVTVYTEPSNPAQVCTIANGAGTVSTANVSNVTVTCVTTVLDRVFADSFEIVVTGSAALAQTTDTTPVGGNSIACGNSPDGGTTVTSTSDNQYWRRYYFSEYSVSTAASVNSVDVSIEETIGAPALTVTLYTIPHSVTVDTIDVGQLTQIGQTVVTSPTNAMLTSINVPITGTIGDTVGNDLVVEVSTADGSGDNTSFYIGSTSSAETHPSFISSTSCQINNPTSLSNVGFPNMHIIEAVNITD